MLGASFSPAAVGARSARATGGRNDGRAAMRAAAPESARRFYNVPHDSMLAPGAGAGDTP
jgi:hypothetical protein